MPTQFRTRDFPELQRKVAAVRRLIGSPEKLLKKWGVLVVQDIDETFRAGGRPKWAPLSKWTVAGRRQRSNRPLRDTRTLQRTWDVKNIEVRHTGVTIFSTSPIAIYHQYGSRTQNKREITAKQAQALAIPQSPFSLRGLGRSQQLIGGAFLFQPAPGQKVSKKLTGYIARRQKKFGANVPIILRAHKNLMFRKKVMVGPLPARPMLPTEDRIVPKLNKAADNMIRAAWQGRAQ